MNSGTGDKSTISELVLIANFSNDLTCSSAKLSPQTSRKVLKLQSWDLKAPIIIFGLFVEGSAVAAWSIVASKEQAILVGTLSAIGTLMIWPAQTVMITRSTQEEDRQGAFAVNFMMLNLGIAFGGLIAASIIQEGNLRSFQTLYLVDSLSYFGYLIIILSIKDKFVASETESKKTGAGYREVLKDRTFMRIILGGLGYITFGYASLQAGLAIFTTQFLELSPKWLGLVFAANTISIFFLPAG